MKAIAEMSLEELQDYALELESKKTALETQLTEKDNSITELTDTNLKLQMRNNALFMQVEQGIKKTPQSQEDPEEVDTCEEYAIKNLKGVLR